MNFPVIEQGLPLVVAVAACTINERDTETHLLNC